MSIVTFYSYKGGVGRSMALANIAFELARRNKKVLMIDWDLEAPGLERYFSTFEIDKQAEGLLPLLLTMNDTSIDYKDFLWTISTTFAHPIYLLHSGRDKDPVKYSKDLEAFDWDTFFNEGKGGSRLEELRNKWRDDFDIVLIDSRTGLSDASGICTIMLPDVIIPMFTANYQSLFGIRDIMSLIQSARQRLSVDRMALTVLPVPSRFGTRVEFKESQEWLDRIADILKDCFSDWLPKWIEPRYIIEQIKIPQVDYFSFGEKLAVVEQGTNDPEGMGFIYAKLSDFLASDFTDIKTFVGEKHYSDKKQAYEKDKVGTSNNDSVKKSKYRYDLYISYNRSTYQWVRETFLPALKEYLSDDLGYNPEVFFDVSEISSGDNWNEIIKSAIESSRIFIFIFSDYGKSDIQNNELIFAEAIQRIVRTNIIIPILFRKTEGDYSTLPRSIVEKQITDLSAYTSEALNSSHRLSAQFGSIIEKLSHSISRSIKESATEASSINNLKINIQSEVESLANAYEQIRKQMTSSNNRTRLMQDIVEKMQLKADNLETVLPDLINSELPGKRLAAIATLQKKPNIEYVDWLAEHVGDIEKPFVGYQASVALYIAARSLDNKSKISKALDQASINIDKFKYKDPNQISVLDSAKYELKFRRKRIYVSYDHSEDTRYKDLLKAWDTSMEFDFQLDLRSPTFALDNIEANGIKAALTKKMKESEYILVIIGERAHSSKWMRWEIERAKQADTNLKFAAVKLKPTFQSPLGLPRDTVFANSFTFEELNRILQS